MNQHRFDQFTQVLGKAGNRRSMLKALAGAVVTSAVGSWLNHSDLEAAATSCALQTYNKPNSAFTGDPIRADVQFFDSLDSVNTCAIVNGVTIAVTSSYRKPNQSVPGA